MIYLDNCATTNPLDCVIEKMSYIMKNNFANPSSTHKFGIESYKIIEETRKNILEFIGIAKIRTFEKNNVIFTSGGTEANNLAIFGTLNKKIKEKKIKILTTKIEHDSVLLPIKTFENRNNFEIIYLKLDKYGNIDLNDIIKNIDENTRFISIMMVNNEIGTISPIKKISQIINESKFKDRILFHVDAVQAFGKIPIDVFDLDVDFLSASSHKIHGPKGLGFLYCKNKKDLSPIFFGGTQENSLKPGTQSVELIAGFNEAVKKCDMVKNYSKIKDLNIYLRNELRNIDDIKVNSPYDAIYNILNFSLLGIKSEILLNFLSNENIFISSASACTKNKQSHVLKALGLDNNIINSAVRVSFSRFNTKEEIDIFASNLRNAKSNILNFV